jgi:hypothetical protein
MAERTCSIDGCEKPARCRGWCHMHYNRWARHGSTEIVHQPHGKVNTAEARFWRAFVESEDGCWVWARGLDQDGYGQFTVNDRQRRAHRFAYELLVGPIPDGLQLDHLCRNPSCVNPGHLEPVTPRENNLRGETFGARNAAKTHCKRGHPFDEENTYVNKRGGRCCRACARFGARQKARAAGKPRRRYRKEP